MWLYICDYCGNKYKLTVQEIPSGLSSLMIDGPTYGYAYDGKTYITSKPEKPCHLCKRKVDRAMEELKKEKEDVEKQVLEEIKERAKERKSVL